MKRGPLSPIEELLFDISLAWAWTVIIALSVFTIGLACFGGTNVLPPEPAPTDKNTKTIAGVGTFISTYDWQRTPWYRIEDAGILTPVLVIVATDGSACLVEGKDWAVAQQGKRFACSSKWRFARPR